ncbi:MAG: DNA helicase UvrD [Gammaproteobacteria bacterium]|nr:MAG: DNA helicase UvrD [Gammaproteobacteria bacterium]
MSIVDAAQRATAIDPTASFCVSAPAGSGKTELLIQRYLCLLSRVARPEQVLAITFTRKAAAEMRGRVVEALQGAGTGDPCDTAHQQVTRNLAEQALAADARGGWHLVRDISRLNIKTIDSFCGGLTRQMPVLSEFGGQANLLDDATELYAEAVVALFGEVDSDHPVAADLVALMLHFDNNWERLQELLVSMLARRDQWRRYVGVHHAPEESEAYLLTTVEALVRGELAGLSRTLLPYAFELLQLQQFAAGNLGNTPPQQFPGSEPGDVPRWRALRDLLLTKDGGWRKSISKTIGFPTGKGEPQERKDQLKSVLGDLQQMDGLQPMLAGISYLPVIEPGSASWQLLVHLSRLLPLLAAQLLLVFQKHGAVDHSQVALSALQALGEDDAPTELALRLDYQIEHILVDEFQDTAINQYDLIHKLTRGWGLYNAENPQAPRTVMIVGDGMQSIYGFRGANVGLFLKARLEGFNGVSLQHLELLSNFRSDEGLVDWVNETFTWAFPAQNDINRGQVSYTPATAVRPVIIEPAVVMHAFHGQDRLEAQAQEVAFICAHIAAACAEHSCGSIAVLGRSRSHLQPIIAGLKQLKISYNAQDLDSLAHSSLVADLLTLCRALANGADRLAWMALLRAPWCGLQLADLLLVASYGEAPRYTPVWSALCSPQLHDRLSTDGRQRLQHLLPPLRLAQKQRDRRGLRVWIEQAWVGLGGPACARDSGGLQDAESFFQLLEQADMDGIGLDAQWLEQRLQKRYMSGGDPASVVQLMTLHKAKGLEFDRVIIPQLAKLPRSDGRQLLLWDEHSGPEGERNFLLAADDHSEAGAPTLYNYLAQQRQQKTLLEGTRLLYVGATRAISQLLLTASLTWDEKKQAFRTPSSRCLLSPIWPTFEQQMIVHEPELVRVVADTMQGDQPLTRPDVQSLTRLVRDAPQGLPWFDTPDKAGPAQDHNIPVRAGNHAQRSIGTVVHLVLEELSRRDTLPNSVTDTDRQRWRMALQREGLWGASLNEALKAVASSVMESLRDGGVGRWLLSSEHEQARSEWALTRVDEEGRIQDLVIDRSFLDADSGVRWLVDYKNSQPRQGEALQEFLESETAIYRDQLLRYRSALRELYTEPLCCALYFTALGHLHHLDEVSGKISSDIAKLDFEGFALNPSRQK